MGKNKKGSITQKTDVDEHIDLINTLGDMLGQTAKSKMERFVYMSCISKTACFLINCTSLFPPVWTERGAETAQSCLIHWSSIIELQPQCRTGPKLAHEASTNQRPSRH